jgi:hypothetical protein
VNTAEAREILKAQLALWRQRSYSDLAAVVDQCRNFETQAPSGRSYQVEIQVFWDDRPNGDIRVMGSIDDGGWRAFVPVTESFLLSADGTFVGE